VSYNLAAAEAYCIMHGMRFDGEYHGEAAAGGIEENDPADDWKNTPATSGPSKGDPLLSKKQKATLAQLANGVFNDLDELGLIDVDGDTKYKRLANWRHDETKKACGKSSLTQCRNSDYRKIYDWFSAMTGRSYNPQMHCTGKQSGQRGDTMERREQLIILIEEALMEHARVVSEPRNEAERAASQIAQVNGGSIGEGYILSIARAKNKHADLKHFGDLIKLKSVPLEQLLYTTRNRIAAREGRGSTKNRNKNQ